MHYSDGTEVKLGDICRKVRTEVEKAANYQVHEVMGVVVAGYPQSDGCNLQVIAIAQKTTGPMGDTTWYPFSYAGNWTLTAKECVLVAR